MDTSLHRHTIDWVTSCLYFRHRWNQKTIVSTGLQFFDEWTRVEKRSLCRWVLVGEDFGEIYLMLIQDLLKVICVHGLKSVLVGSWFGHWCGNNQTMELKCHVNRPAEKSASQQPACKLCCFCRFWNTAASRNCSSNYCDVSVRWRRRIKNDPL